ncbi:MAG: hypothetical protein JWR06_2678, partial [Jatrophihabitans sp.]|nr:hypothetical protein [Jatrophihabitans sp.]
MTATGTAQAEEPNVQQRRRGAPLEEAIRQAAYAEL